MQKIKKYLALAGLMSILGIPILKAQAPGWSVNPATYANSMNIIAQLQVDEAPENGTSNLLGAFVGNEVRGVASPQLVGGQAYYFLTVYSDVVSGETVTFKAYLSDSDAIFDSVDEVDFVKNAQLGNIPDGFPVNISLGGDFPVALSPIPADSTLVGIPFPAVPLEDYLITIDDDPVTWTVGTSPNLQGTIDGSNNLEVAPLNPTWTGTDSLLITVTEIGTPNGYFALQWVRFTVQEDYGMPEFDTMPVWFVQNLVPLPSGDLSEAVTFAGPCLEYAMQLTLPEGTLPAPVWAQPNTNSGSMTVIVQADFGGNRFRSASNLLAGYVDGQMAGFASPTVVNGESLFFLTLANVGNGPVTFKLYDNDHQYLHAKESGLNFVPAGSAGTLAAPYAVDFAPIRVEVDADDGTWTTTVLDPLWEGEQRGMFYATDCEYNQKMDSTEVIFIIGLCTSQPYQLPNGSGLCLQADDDVDEIMWYQDGQSVGETAFHGALTPGVYHYEGLTPEGCPDFKSCPVIIESGPPTGPAPTPPNMPPATPGACGEISLVGITVDETPPVALCQSATIYLNSNGTAILDPSDVDDESFTSCGMGTLSISQGDFDCQHFGVNTVTLTILDTAGRTATCDATVTVQDTFPPSVDCQNAEVQLDGAGQASITPISVYANGGDNCSIVNLISVLPSTFDCTNQGDNEVTLTVNDGHGNEVNCSAFVTISDNTPPTTLCKDISVNLDGDGQASITAPMVDNGSSDPCGILSRTISQSMFDCSHLGPNTVTLSVTDNTGNVSNCAATVTILDATNSQANCKDASVLLDSNGTFTLTPALIDDGSTDNCAVANRSVIPSTLDCSNIGTSTVTLQVYDSSNNLSTCTAQVTVAPFFVLDGVIVTPELCGDGNGSITVLVSAPTAPAAQIGYSIDGGASFQFVPTFTELEPGNYNILAQAFGSTGCTLDIGPLTVGTEAIGTWYLDADGDGHSEGTSQTACAQPAGGWYLDVQLIATSGDCDDDDPTIYPGAPELCNGIDNNCDGIIESQVNTWTGNGDQIHWDDPANWSNGLVPLDCQDVVIPAGFNVTVEAGIEAVGRTLEVAPGADLELQPAAIMYIAN